VHVGRAKFATGAVLSGGEMLAPSLHAEASTKVPVTAASIPIDRIIIPAKSDEVPREPTELTRLHAPEPCQSPAGLPQVPGRPRNYRFYKDLTP
jgi:hypothetical protein